MSLDDFLDELIQEKKRMEPAAASQPRTAVATGPAPGAGSQVGDSLSSLIDKVSAEQGGGAVAVAAVAASSPVVAPTMEPSAQGSAGTGAVIDEQTRQKLAMLSQMQEQMTTLEQKVRQQEHRLGDKDEEIQRLTEQYNLLKEKSQRLVVEYQKLKEGTVVGGATGSGGVVVNFPWKRHLNVVQETINKKDIATADGMLRVLLEASELLAADIAVRLRLMTQMAAMHLGAGKIAEAEDTLNKAVSVMDSVAGARKTLPGAYCLDALAQCHQDKENFEEAEKLRREAVIVADECVGGEHPEAIWFRERLDNLRQQRQMAQIGDNERTLFDNLKDEFKALVDAGQSTTLEVKPTEAVAGLMFDKFMANAKSALAMKNNRDAESYLRSAIEKAEGIANNDPRKCEGLRLLASTLEVQSKDADARAFYDTALTIAFKYLGTGDVQVAQCLESLANVHTRLGDFGLAKNYYRQAIAVWKASLGAEDESVKALEAKYEQFLQVIKEDRKWKSWSE